MNLQPHQNPAGEKTLVGCVSCEQLWPTDQVLVDRDAEPETYVCPDCETEYRHLERKVDDGTVAVHCVAQSFRVSTGGGPSVLVVPIPAGVKIERAKDFRLVFRRFAGTERNPIPVGDLVTVSMDADTLRMIVARGADELGLVVMESVGSK